ncbi:hypothetical protein ACO1MN_15140, partial [Staphylococcus aureus]
GIEKALETIKAKTLVIGISSDLLFPKIEQEQLAFYIPDSQLAVIDSQFGHDGFLLEFDAITSLVKNFMQVNKDYHKNIYVSPN